MKKALAKEIYDDGYVTGYKASIEEFLEDFENIRISADMEDIYLPYIFWEIEKKWEKRRKE